MVAPIGGVGAFDAIGQLANVGGSTGTSKSGAGDAFGKVLQGLEDKQGKANDLLSQAMTGDLTDVHQYMVAATEAQTSLELATTIRNRAIDAFNEIMRMQV
jgi:flagellar hook-basal body complex protein FliE